MSQFDFLKDPPCVICGSKSVTIVRYESKTRHVCKEHHKEYQEEGRKYLPFHERVVLQKILDSPKAR